MNNLEKFKSLLKEGEGLLLTSRFSRHYGAEFDIAEGVAVVSARGCRYLTDSRYIESAQNNIRGFEVQLVAPAYQYNGLLNKAIEDFGIHTLGYEESYLTARELMEFKENLRADLIPMGQAITAFRASKEDWELERMRKAQKIADASFAQILTKIHPGMTEREVQAELIYCLYKNGADRPSFDPIVVSGPNTSMPHGVAGDRVIREGDFVTMDFGALYEGYCSDMTRTVAVGYATEEMRRVYDTVLRAQQAGIDATRAGIPGKEIDRAARTVIEKAGYGPYFGHGYGHSLGLEIHEAPNCNTLEERNIPVGAVISAEPGIYLPGKFGVRIEDVVVFTEEGCENITGSPKELIIL